MAVHTRAFLLALIINILIFTHALPSGRDTYEEYQWADVQVNLSPAHASADIHGHAETRSHTNESTLTVKMDTTHYRLSLTPTTWLVAPGASLRRVGAEGNAQMSYAPLLSRPCLYLAHSLEEEGPAGTLSLCHQDGPHVLLLNGEELAELLPHPAGFSTPRMPVGGEPLGGIPIAPPMPESPMMDMPHIYKRGHTKKLFTHIVKRYPVPAVDDKECEGSDFSSCMRAPMVPLPAEIPVDISQVKVDPTFKIENKKRSGLSSEPLTVELGLFLDQALLETFSKYLRSDEELVDLVLGLVNNVQSLYRHPSLGRTVHLTITHLRLLTVQPDDLPTHRGDRIQLLKSFCEYNKRNNDPDDSNPEHWDIGIYLSGLNFFEQIDDGSENGVTMGLAYTGGVCKPELSCVINEFGTVDYRGRPYPSAGALSSYVLAHEIGHSLGLRHDGVSNTCDRQGYIMAAGRGLRGATTWSSCAREKLQLQNEACLQEGGENEIDSQLSAWDHTTYGGLPGQRWDATAQCRLFLRDDEAGLYDPTMIHEICESVNCYTPKRISSYLAGPALEGTHCGGENWCQGGQCVSWGNNTPEIIVGGWGPWSHSECTSGCVKGSTGYKVSRRACDSPVPKNSIEGCVGIEYVISLCPDDKVCESSPRKTVTELASELCGEVAKLKDDIEAEGRQMSYSSAPDMAWQACALYCQKVNSTSFWTPRYEFKNMPHVPTHLPDGTPCNNEEYVCYNRECVTRESTVASLRIPNRQQAEKPKLVSETIGSDYQEFDVDDLFS